MICIISEASYSNFLAYVLESLQFLEHGFGNVTPAVAIIRNWGEKRVFAIPCALLLAIEAFLVFVFLQAYLFSGATRR